ncbi:hypothetical protein LTR53_001066 [Teratosphaeriaceae sp. CCFEE 6253]|nr:hypothetical protein LTR53_001066 [Teratosphaeriaceae sp. CCFEE 6253]
MAWHDNVARHIQDHDEANTTLQHHWGYASRVLPCTKDSGTCEYLDAVYSMHDTSMTYTFILWGVLLAVAVLWLFIRGWRMDYADGRVNDGLFESLWAQLMRVRRRWLSVDVQDKASRWLFGRVSRLQLLILAVLLGYLSIFTLVGITYRTWITPIKGSTRHNIRTGLGGFSDRIGALAYALTPFTVLLSMRESVLSLITGIPYQHFNFLHRWTSYIIFVQAVLHTIGWTIVEARLYQPQPTVYRTFISQQYMIFGVLAMFILTLMLALSTKTAIRWFGYKAFKLGHWGLAVLYLGACWGHWDRLWCWMVASLALIVLDQAVRMGRNVYLHYGAGNGKGKGFHCAQARMQLLGSAAEGDLVIRVDFEHDHGAPWEAGQHFHLTFPGLSIWQSHPFTPSSLPEPNSRLQHHTYLLRVRKGITARLAALGDGVMVPVILAGPYGRGYPSYGARNVLAVAGGTGVTFTLPIALQALRQQTGPTFAIEFVWVVRRARDLLWLREEILELQVAMKEAPNLRVKIFVTRESEAAHTLASKELGHAVSTSSAETDLDELVCNTGNYSIAFLDGRHPLVEEIVGDFVERASTVGGSAEVVSSGPESMGSDLRSAVALVQHRLDASCYWDSRD